jgi:hypothetical protein
MKIECFGGTDFPALTSWRTALKRAGRRSIWIARREGPVQREGD